MNIYENKSHSTIEEYVNEDYYKFLDMPWEQGYFTDEAKFFLIHQKKYFKVTLSYDVIGEWQEYGDRVYHVEGLKSIKYKECTKLEVENYIVDYFGVKRDNLKKALDEVYQDMNNKLSQIRQVEEDND